MGKGFILPILIFTMVIATVTGISVLKFTVHKNQESSKTQQSASPTPSESPKNIALIEPIDPVIQYNVIKKEIVEEQQAQIIAKKIINKTPIINNPPVVNKLQKKDYFCQNPICIFEGDANYEKKIKRALGLINRLSPEYYKIIERNVRAVVYTTQGSHVNTSDPKTIYIKDPKYCDVETDNLIKSRCDDLIYGIFHETLHLDLAYNQEFNHFSIGDQHAIMIRDFQIPFWNAMFNSNARQQNDLIIETPNYRFSPPAKVTIKGKVINPEIKKIVYSLFLNGACYSVESRNSTVDINGDRSFEFTINLDKDYRNCDKWKNNWKGDTLMAVQHTYQLNIQYWDDTPLPAYRDTVWMSPQRFWWTGITIKFLQEKCGCVIDSFRP